MNVAVKDKSGKAIEDLKKEQFTLLEDGKPQQISVFELERLNGETLPALEAPAPTLKTRGTAETKPSTPPPPVKADQLKDRRLIAMFFDLSSMQPAEQIRAREAAVKFIDTQMTASDTVSIMTLTNELRVVQEFTNDRETLVTAIQALRVGRFERTGGAGRHRRRCHRRQRRVHRRRYRVQYLQYRSQAERAGRCHAQAGAVSGKESAGLFFKRHRQDGRRQSIADSRHRECRRAGERSVLSDRRARLGGHGARWRMRRRARPRARACSPAAPN